MGQIIGQKNLISNLDKLIETGRIPRFMIFVGPWGCGKKTICDYFVKKSSRDYSPEELSS